MSDDERSGPAPEEQVSRKGFIEQGMRHFLAGLAEVMPELPFESQQPLHGVALRPPGALPEEQFVATCEPYCTECQQVCPRDSIFQDHQGLPYIQPEVSPCVMCTDVQCTRVCPTGALLPLTTPEEIAIGTAVIELTVCTAYAGSGCAVCYEVCPLQDKAIQQVEGLPQVIPEACTGCGVCVFDCPTPGAIEGHPLR